MRYLAFLSVFLAIPVQASTYDATIKMVGDEGGNGTGVVVSSFGHVLTAEHLPERVTAEINGVSVPLDLVYEPKKNGRDECRVYRTAVTPVNIQFASVSAVAPKRGDPVFTYGFPDGKRKRLEGKIRSVGEWIHCDFPTWFGHSGGPLFNESGQVVALASASDLRSTSSWIPLTKINEALTAANVSRKLTHTQLAKQKMWAFTMPKCKPCGRFKRDLAAGHFAQFDVEIFDVTTEAGAKKWKDLRAALKKTTGKEPPNLVPSFYIPGRKGVVTGYPQGARPWRKLIKDLLNTLRLPLTVIESIAGLFQSDDAAAVPVPEYQRSEESKQVESMPVPKEGGGHKSTSSKKESVSPPPAKELKEKESEDTEDGGDDGGLLAQLVGVLMGLAFGAVERRLA